MKIILTTTTSVFLVAMCHGPVTAQVSAEQSQQPQKKYQAKASETHPFGKEAFVLTSAIVFSMCSTSATMTAQSAKQLVRLAIIEIDASQIKLYNDFLREEIEASIRLEPGVITLYGVAEKENPQHVTLFETYADSSQYKTHLATPHFQKYKQGTLAMVTRLQLIEMQPIFYHRKASLTKAEPDELYVRLIKMQIDSGSVAEFSELANRITLPGIKNEAGVLAMYAVSEKSDPTRISILEVYKDLKAYNKHIKTTHFLKYKEASRKAVKSLNLIDVDPIRLGSKPQ